MILKDLLSDVHIMSELVLRQWCFKAGKILNVFSDLWKNRAAKQDSNLYIPVEMYPVNNEVHHLWNTTALKIIWVTILSWKHGLTSFVKFHWLCSWDV